MRWQVVDGPERRRKPNIEHHRRSDDLGGILEALERRKPGHDQAPIRTLPRLKARASDVAIDGIESLISPKSLNNTPVDLRYQRSRNDLWPALQRLYGRHPRFAAFRKAPDRALQSAWTRRPTNLRLPTRPDARARAGPHSAAGPNGKTTLRAQPPRPPPIEAPATAQPPSAPSMTPLT